MSIRPQQMEMFIASQTAESLGANIRLLEMVLDRRNMFRALKQVRANKGAPGIDKINVDEIGGYLRRHWTKIKAALRDGSHKPLPVRRKEIDKPDGGTRLPGIPTVLDRVIQQAMAQIVEQIWDPTFSEFSYGFRPGRSAHDAVLQSKQYLLDGDTHVVDMDLSKFFDRVNHDRLMSRLASRIKDKRVLKLIRRYLNAILSKKDYTFPETNLPDQPNRLGTRSVCRVVWEGVAARSLPIPIGRTDLFREVFYVFYILEVVILSPDNAFVRLRCSQYDTVSHWNIILQAQFRSIHCNISVKIDDFAFLHCSNRLESLVFGGFSKHHLEYLVDCNDGNN